MARRASRAAAVAGLVAALAAGACQDDDRPGPVLVVTVAAPGRTPDRMVTEVGEPIEELAARQDGVRHVRTTARADIIAVAIELRARADVDVARAALTQALTAAAPSLPADVGMPSVTAVSRTGRAPVVAATREDWPELDRSLSRQGFQVDAVCRGEPTWEVAIDPVRMQVFGLGLDRLFDALRTVAVDAPAGSAGGAEALRDLMIPLGDSRQVPLSELANVQVATSPRCQGYLDGEPSWIATAIGPDRSIQASAGRVLDGPAIHGGYPLRGARPDALELMISTAAVGARAVAVQLDRSSDTLVIDVALGARQRGSAVAHAIDDALGAHAIRDGRWSGAGIVTRTETIVVGPDAQRQVAALAERAQRAGFRSVCEACAEPSIATHVIDRARAAELGVATPALAKALQLALTGVEVGRGFDDRGAVEIRAVLAPSDRDPLDAMVTSRVGLVPLRELVTVQSEAGPTVIERVDRRRVYSVLWWK